ncbi:MAG: hypothetical protein INH34_14555 [Phycisphaerales bacterium]|jgi:hypothetical protein|nr:hypothetical protein [Phycisphaerales bacterium]
MRRAAVFAVLLALPACWSSQSFTPRERLDAQGPGGVPAALYTVPAAEAGGPSTAEVRVWSHGAKARYADDDREIVELHVGFELENNASPGGAAGPLRLDLDAIACEELQLDGVLQPPLKPVRVQGDGVAAPGQTARVDLLFEPATTKPRDLDSFRIRFAVRDGERAALQQVVPFGPWTRNLDDDPYWRGYYAWGWGPGWGPGWGSAWGPGWGWGPGWHVGGGWRGW